MIRDSISPDHLWVKPLHTNLRPGRLKLYNQIVVNAEPPLPLDRQATIVWYNPEAEWQPPVTSPLPQRLLPLRLCH